MAKRSVRELLLADPSASDGALGSVDPASTPGVGSKAKALAKLPELHERVFELQERLWAEHRRSLLLVLQGMDTSGKDGTIKHVIGGLDPAGARIVSFKQPTAEERRHDFLWRIRRGLPAPGQVGIFNRSHYEDVLVVRVHGLVPPAVWRARYDEINRFEAEVEGSGTRLVKVVLHISPEEQRLRLLARLDDPTKRWKFDANDLRERRRWPDYRRAYADAVRRCSTEVAPWFVVPADRKWYRNWAVTNLLLETLEDMAPVYPEPPLDLPALRAALAPGG